MTAEPFANRTAVRGSLLVAFAERAAARAHAQADKASTAAAAFDDLAAQARAQESMQAPASEPNPATTIAPPRRAGPVDIDELYARASGSLASGSPGPIAQIAPPADPVWLAQACADAGFPDLTVKLLQQRASVAAVHADLERANTIVQAARSFRVPELAATAIVSGLGVDVFRELVMTRKVADEAAIVTAHSGGAMQAAVKTPNGPAIYDRLNRAGG